MRPEDALLWLGALVDSSDDAIIGKTLDGIITSWNRAAERIYGYTAEEVVGRSIRMLIPPERVEEFESIMAALRQRQRIDHIETIRVRRDGARIDVSVTISPILDSRGRLIGASSIARDITERKLTEEALRQSEEKYRTIVQTANEGVWLIDAEARTLFANERMAAILGCTVEEMMGRPVPEFVFPSDIPGTRERVRNNLAGLPEQFDTRFRRKDGSEVFVLARTSPVRDGRGAISGALGMFTDVTVRRRSEQRLRASEERFRALANAVPSIVWTADPDGTITYASDQWFEYCGLTPEENARGWPQLVLHPDDVDRCLALWNDALQHGTEYEIEIRNRRHDGEYRWFLTRAVPARDAAGSITAWFGTTTDIHDRKLAEEQRALLLDRERAAHAEAAKAVLLRDQFLSIASHELKTPLTSLLGNAEMLWRRVQREGSYSERDTRAIRVIAEQAARLNRLINVLLDITRIQQGQLTIERAPLDLCALALRVAGEVRLALTEHTVDVSAEEGGLVVLGDELRLEQVLHNLIQNAIRYSPDGGPVRVTVERRATHACVSVVDRGIGIPESALPNLFQRFYRAPNAGSQHASGLGIGLYVVKEIVTLHGGDVEVETAEGRGSTFTISLPLEGACEP